MRFYVFTPGLPGYISAEHAIRDLPEAPTRHAAGRGTTATSTALGASSRAPRR